MHAIKELVGFIMEQFLAHKELLITLAIGGACGLFGQMILPGKGLGIVPTIIVGIIGCYAGGFFLMKYITFADNKTLKTIIAGTVGSMVILAIINLFKIGEPKHKDKTKWRNNA